VFYLDEVLVLNEGEVVKGRIHVRPNANNHRDIDIQLEVSFEGALCSAHTKTEYKLR